MNPTYTKTRRAWNEPGHAHFLTYSCFRRLPLLVHDRARHWVVSAFESTRRELDVSIWAYVIMPEHVHLLIHPRQPDYEMRRILAALKRSVSHAAHDWLHRTRNHTWLERLTVESGSRTLFRFWMPGGGFDRDILHDESVPAIIDYIHANPVRRDLVAQPAEWVWSSARFWDGYAEVPIQMDEPTL